jgi:glycosyltransferase involved in cell wall biosynthesis
MITSLLAAHGRGGVQDHVLLLARGIVHQGHKVIVLTTARNDGITVETTDNVQIEYLPRTDPGQSTRVWREQSIRRIAAIHREKHIDIVHCQGSDSIHVLRSPEYRRLQIPTFISFHGTSWDLLKTVLCNGFSWRFFRTIKSLVTIIDLLSRYLLREIPSVLRASALIATSNEQLVIYNHLYGFSKAKIFRIYNGIDSDLFQPGQPDSALRSRHTISPEAPVILCAARLIFAKGIQYTIQALRNVVESIPAAQLIIVGEGNYQDILKKLVEDLELSEHVRFAGAVPLEELPKYFHLCDVFVNATHQQNGYDLTMAEAMACEKVVLSSNIGSTPTLITHDVDGILFKTRDIQQLSATLVEILQDDAKRFRIGKTARKKVVQYFNQKTMTKDTIAAYENICRPASSLVDPANHG